MIKAFILCAGLGTRLRPLTLRRPKALLPLKGKPIIFHIIEHLKSIGVKEVILNTHHMSHTFDEVLGDGSKIGIKIHYSDERDLLETGGGLKKVESFFKDTTFIMYNCDVITNVNLEEMLIYHRKNKNKVTLLSSSNRNPKCLVVDSKNKVSSIVVSSSNLGTHAFCGIHIIEPFIFEHIPEGEKISIVKTYLKLIEEGIPIDIFPIKDAFWQEIGSMESYNKIQDTEF